MIAPDNYSGHDAYVGTDAMSAYMRGLAERLPCGGRAVSSLGRGVRRRLKALSAQDAVPDSYRDNIKWIISLADELSRERPVSLPAAFSQPRVEIIARELVSHSLFSLDVEGMARALEAFDSKQGLTIEEIWLFPRQARIELVRAYLEALERASANADFRDAAFLSNIVSSLRAITNEDWKPVFERICRAERVLAQDVIYARQDEISKSFVRSALARISRKSGLSEWSVARRAAKLAQAEPQAPKNTCVYWLCDPDGRAELFSRLAYKRPPVKLINTQQTYIAAFAAIFACLTAFLTNICGAALVAPVAALAWRFAKTALDRLLAWLLPVRPLLSLEFDTVPEEYRTLVVVPALLSSVERAAQVVGQLAALGRATERDAVEYLLLGDFRDSPDADEPDDRAIAARARKGIEALNNEAGRARYHYLLRPRVYCENDRRYMARERKRGALMELNKLLLGEKSEFDAEGLAGRFKYVLTLDADTRATPGVQRALIGAIAHPLNRRRRENGVIKGYGVIVPRVEQTLSTRFSRLVARPGGLDAYPASSSSAYWDAAGVCVYCGKGIYDVRAFQRAVSDVVPDKCILSHDLLEGALAGAGLKNDAVALDDFPPTLAGFTKRLHRWTRGDWQLLPFIFTLPLSPLSRFMMLDNLVSSLVAPMALLLIIFGCAAGEWPALILGFLSAVSGEITSPKRALAALALLPHKAWAALDAALRALYRVFVSRRDLLQWTPAADERGEARGLPRGKIVALALLAGLFQGPIAPFAALMGLIFWTGESWLKSGDTRRCATAYERRELTKLAEATWRYFVSAVPMDSKGLPPDNIQIYPYAGAAKRTSPTNISMYLLSCLAAELLGAISPEEARKRIEKTVGALEKLEKWRGQFYNWYDTETLLPLNPRYVSSVDGGNLAAGLMLLSNRYGGALGSRIEALYEKMELQALYDERRKLFYIGYDETAGRYSDSHYDLMASESRILSFAAIALGKVKQEHWRYLGRQSANGALLSWSGTAFEYLMPEIFFPSRPGTLLNESAKAYVSDGSGVKGGLWGVSESGYYAFDSRLNYQYRAFGLAKFALGRDEDGMVIAPYASALALLIDPERAMESLESMKRMGLIGEMGLYEAVDFDPARLAPGAERMTVKSHMTHHQGMILCSIAEYLTSGALSRAFTSRPDARAYSPLLDERPALRRSSLTAKPPKPAKSRRQDLTRRAETPLEGHLIYGAGTRVLATGGGVCLTNRHGADVERFSGFFSPNDGAATVLCVGGETLKWSLGAFSPGEAAWSARGAGVACRLRLTVSALDGAVYRAVDMENLADKPLTATVYNTFALSLCGETDYAAHPAFMNMFVESEKAGANQARFTRHGRAGQAEMSVVCAAYAPPSAEISLENDLARLIGRRGGLFDAEIYPKEFAFGEGRALDACLCQRVVINLQPGEKSFALFALGFGEDFAASPGDMRGRFDRARQLARARQTAENERLAIDDALYNLFDAQSTALFCKRGNAREGLKEVSRNDLWEMGLDAAKPIIAAKAFSREDLPAAREALKRALFYRSMGADCSLALINDEREGYRRAVGEALQETAALFGAEAKVVSGTAMSERNRAALELCAITRDTPPVEPRNTALTAKPDYVSGGFTGFGRDEYIIDAPALPPAPWCNVLANERFGAIISERAGGFCWAGNSRLQRITPWTGDALYEGEIFSLRADGCRLAPCRPPFKARHGLGWSAFSSRAAGLEWNMVFSVPPDAEFLKATAEITSDAEREITITLSGNFLMGADACDARLLSYGYKKGLIIASGAMRGKGFLYMKGARPLNGALTLSVRLKAGEPFKFEVILGWAASEAEFMKAVTAPRREAREYWRELLSGPELVSPDETLNAFISRWLPYQTVSSRVFARSGFYQSGGAIGFRDQLQDMLVMIALKPGYARKHILYCASRQFERGDALHWWHPPASGVRTRVADDRVFLPYITAKYVSRTNDESILDASVPYLKDKPIPEGARDLYDAFEPSDVSESLTLHCMRAIRLSARAGEHGLALMEGGDWNDGMDEVNGESVWLSEFLAATCEEFAAALCEGETEYKRELYEIAEKMKKAVEESGWDGAWYRRAYYQDGEALGSKNSAECQIDLVSQSWAVLAGLNDKRCVQAMDGAWERLDEDGVIKLLTPGFAGLSRRPGYIANYPLGVRENGGQYTHAACWAIMAEAKMGRADRAWDAVYALLPYCRDEKRYRAEPYVLPADVYAGEYAGRAGWTWYTGAAAWLYEAVFTGLMGYERKGNKARLNALLRPEWEEASVAVREGQTKYVLTARRAQEKPTLDGNELSDGWLEISDDGKEHAAVFPARKTEGGTV